MARSRQYGRMTTRSFRTRSFRTATLIRRRHWQDPKVPYTLHYPIQETQEFISAKITLNDKLLIIFNCQQKINVIVFNKVSNDWQIFKSHVIKNNILSNEFEVFCAPSNGNYILVPTTFNHTESLMIFNLQFDNIITRDFIRPSHFFINSPRSIKLNHEHVLFWTDKKKYLNASRVDLDARCIQYFPNGTNGRKASEQLSESNINITTIDSFGGSCCILIDSAFKDSICRILYAHENWEIIHHYETKPQSIEYRIKNAKDARFFQGIKNHCWAIIDEVITSSLSDNILKTSIFCLDIIKQEWITVNANLDPKFDGIFLNHVNEIICFNDEDVCYCIGSWSNNNNMLYNIMKINLHQLLPAPYIKQYTQNIKSLCVGWIRNIEKQYKLQTIPVALKILISRFY